MVMNIKEEYIRPDTEIIRFDAEIRVTVTSDPTLDPNEGDIG